MDDRTPFEKRSRQILEESAAKLDGRTLSRLTQARHAALDGGAKRSRPRWMTFAPVGAAAAVAVLAIAMWTGNGASDPALLAPADDMELLADVEAPDFTVVAEDLEFYEWAADEVET